MTKPSSPRSSHSDPVPSLLDTKQKPTNGLWLASLHGGSKVEFALKLAPDGDWRGAAVVIRGQEFRAYGKSDCSILTTASEAHCTVVFDGKLYNRNDFMGHLFGSTRIATSDADLVLHAYLNCGDGVLPRLKGTFALLIWDGRQNTLLCARDAVGVYPLFYACDGNDFLVSTSIQALLRQPQVSGAVNRAALADHLCDRWTRPDETYFDAVKRLPPGHAMRIGEFGTKVFRYWNPASRDATVEWSDDEVMVRFETLMRQAVRRCMEWGQIGIFLSGGLDSITVSTVATEDSRERGLSMPWAFSLAFPDSRGIADDVVQRRVAERLGMPHLTIGFEKALGPRGMLLAALELSRRMSAPLMNRADPAYHVLSVEARRRGCRAVLTGGGGDEWLTVAPHVSADLMLAHDLIGLIRLYVTLRRSEQRTRRTHLRHVLWTFGSRILLQDAIRRTLQIEDVPELRSQYRIHVLRSLPTWLAPDPALRRELADRAEQSFAVRHQGSFYSQELRSLLEHPLEIRRHEEVFECERLTGIRMLRPFWDCDLVEFFYQLPPRLKNFGGRSKGLVRPMLSTKLPGLGFELQKKVDGPGLQRYVSIADAAKAWNCVGGAPTLAALGIVDEDALRPPIASILGSPNLTKEYPLWDLLNLETWTHARI